MNEELYATTSAPMLSGDLHRESRRRSLGTGAKYDRASLRLLGIFGGTPVCVSAAFMLFYMILRRALRGSGKPTMITAASA